MSNLTGATSLANTIRTLLAQTKAQLDKASGDLTVAVGELQNTATEAAKQVKIVQNETADLRAALGLGTNGGEPLDDDVVPIRPGAVTMLPRVQYETPPPSNARLTDVVPPPPFYGPAKPHHDTDPGFVEPLKLANGELTTKVS